MRIELILLVIVAGVCYHIYTDGKWIVHFTNYKKYLQIAGVIIIGLVVYWVFKKDPVSAQKLLCSTNDYIKYLPIDKDTAKTVMPIIDFTKKWAVAGSPEAPIKMARSAGSGSPKRSVSESKKKYVASEQGWKCAECGEQLKATFEVDHIIPIYKFPANSTENVNAINNLRALCVECHKMKTMQDTWT